LRKKWNVKLGQIWQLGDHRLICGDSTSSETVGRLMDGGKAVLLHADPPYGMGKENEGIANDNLYRDKLDAFQMDWWRACRPSLADNGSAYIWGNAPDLWRLWYVGGLADSERLTVRNEIVWEKKTALGLNAGNGIGSSLPRQFANLSERCLFFMLGEQGFNSNADNYWEGFDPIRKYLDGERRAMGWDMKTIAAWFGFHPRMADHWFSVSQWSFIRPEQYARLQAEAKGDAFKREHDDLKREHDDLKREHDDLKRDFYATRAYFDNTHDNMTDVWQFDRVSGEERQGHATPKPVEMMGRVMKSSARAGDLVIEPFIGSGSTLIAAENTGRHCRGIEIDPAYVAVTIERWHEATGKEPEQIK
jgi:DNA modification methylase